MLKMNLIIEIVASDRIVVIILRRVQTILVGIRKKSFWRTCLHAKTTNTLQERNRKKLSLNFLTKKFN